jgi:hypothetical protein
MKICKFPGCKKKYCAKGWCNSHWAQYARHRRVVPLRVYESLEDRLWRQVKRGPSNKCWIYFGPHTGKDAYRKKGYGQIYWKGKKYPAHRLSYILTYGKIPATLQIDHRCRNKMCVNPKHLEAISQNDNMKRLNAYRSLKAEVKRLRKLVIKLGGDPGADFFTLPKFQ